MELRIACGVAALGAVWLSAAEQQPTFRSTVDLIAVEAQVVTQNGDPIAALGPQDFEVSIRGRRRRVVSADFERAVRGPVDVTPGEGAARSADADPSGDARTARTFIVAVDTSSFDVGSIRAPLEAARTFVSALSPSDLVGLHVYPNGPRVEPSTGRAVLRQRLGEVLGNQNPFEGIYHLRPSEVIDITATSAGVANPGGVAGRARAATLGVTPAMIDANPVLGVQARECPDDPECAARIVSEASAMALHYEGQVHVSLGGLQSLLRSLIERPGRKTVVLISGGVVVSDRIGGRPDVGDLAEAMGQLVAAANTTLYTIHIDAGLTGIYGAARRRVADSERVRDRVLRGDWLDRFSLAAGGSRIYVPVGAGEFAFDRVLRETSATYLLGVEPAEADRDGRPRELKVRVNARGATVRARQWVVVPAKG